MTLGELHTLVSSSIARGTTLDAQIPAFVRMAARWLERNYTFKYMERFRQFTFDTTATEPRRITMASGRVKKIEMARGVYTDGSFQKQKQIDPEELNSIQEGMPKSFWLDGVNCIVFDKTPDENYTEEMKIIEYTSWPTATSAETWLTVNAEDLLLARAMMHMAPFLRDPKVIQYWKELYSTSLQTVLNADQELRDGARSDVMNYAGAFRDDD